MAEEAAKFHAPSTKAVVRVPARDLPTCTGTKCAKKLIILFFFQHEIVLSNEGNNVDVADGVETTTKSRIITASRRPANPEANGWTRRRAALNTPTDAVTPSQLLHNYKLCGRCGSFYQTLKQHRNDCQPMVA